MAKGSNTTRSGGANTRASSVASRSGGRITVDSGYPQSTLDEAQRRLDALNAEFGFNPDVHFINKKFIDVSNTREALGRRAKDNTLELGTEANRIPNEGIVVDHEYGHLFDVRPIFHPESMRRLLKINKEGSMIYKNYHKKMDELQQMKKDPLFPKWKKLDKIYQEARRDARGTRDADTYKFTNIKEYAAETFAIVRLHGLAKAGERAREFYRIMITLPKHKAE